MDKQELETPALLIDLDALEKNIKTMADYYRAKSGAVLMPHQKGHRLPIIAKKQMQAGASAVSSTSLGLAEYYVNSGIDNILITSEICGATKIARLCALSKHSNITVGVDDIENAKQLSEAALSNKTRINIAVELYMESSGSAGVQLREAKSLVKELTKFRGTNFRGLWWHEGRLSSIRNFEERKRMEFAILDEVARVRDEIEDMGTTVELLSGGFTCTWNITPEYSRLSKVGVQAGSYVFSDWTSHLIEGIEVFDYALTVLTTCVSRPSLTEAIFDSGMNSCSDENGENYASIVGPKFKNLEGLKRIWQREEIMQVIFDDPTSDVRVGDVFELIPPHSDTTAKLHNKYYGIRDNKVEVVWPNYGRGLF